MDTTIELKDAAQIVPDEQKVFVITKPVQKVEETSVVQLTRDIEWRQEQIDRMKGEIAEIQSNLDKAFNILGLKVETISQANLIGEK